MDERERKVLADIEEHGCHIIHVLEDDEGPPFAYSVGIQQSSRSPEVIVVGLARSLAHWMINEYCRRVRAGERFVAGVRYSGFLEGFEVQFEPTGAAHHAEYMGWACWLYGGTAFEAVQMIYPTTTGVWPWDDDASPAFRARQPLLSAQRTRGRLDERT